MRISDWSSDGCSSDLRNTPILEQAASSSAVFNLVPGNDGVVRSVPAFLVAEGQIVPGLVAELLRIASGGDAFIIKTDSAGIRPFVVAGVEVPTDRHGPLRVPSPKPERNAVGTGKGGAVRL